MKIGSLFSGVAGLDRAVESFFDAEVAWFVEFDAAPSKVLAHHYPNVPNYGDVTTVDWASVEPVDILTGGFPCQDVSLAGARRGLRDGTRSGLWSEYAKAIDILRPKLVVIENVRGLLSAQTIEEVDASDSELEPGQGGMGEPTWGDRPVLNAFGRVLGDLAELGYDAEWAGLRAADAGAPHNRFRVFCIAYPHGQRHQWAREARGWRDGSAHNNQPLADPSGDESERRGRAGDLGGAKGASEADGEEWQRVWDAASYSGPVSSADTGRVRSWLHEGGGDEGGPEADSRFTEVVRPGDGAGDAEGHGSDRETAWGVYAPAIEHWEAVIGRVAPSPTKPDGRDGGQRLNPELTEWMMGWPLAWVTDPAIGLTRNEQLKACGNGVVTQQALLALETMANRHGVPA